MKFSNRLTRNEKPTHATKVFEKTQIVNIYQFPRCTQVSMPRARLLAKELKSEHGQFIMDLSIKYSEPGNNGRLQDNLQTSIRLIQLAHDLGDVYAAVRLVIDLPDTDSKSQMRQHLAKLAASFLIKDFGVEMMNFKAAFIVELAEKIAELPDEEFI